MKRVLFLAYLFPPIANSGTQRPLKFAKYLVEFGWQPIVLTAAHVDGHHTDYELLKDLPAGIRVERVPMVNERIGDAVATLLGGGVLGRKIGDAVRWRLQSRYRSPDYYAMWQPTAVRAGMRIFRESGFDAIFATGYPWTALMAGRALAAATGRPLVADFRDLWAGEHRFRDERPSTREEIALEQQVVDSAHAVVAASTTIARSLVAAHPQVNPDKFIAIHNGFDRDDLSVRVAPKPQGRFRIVFTGIWRRDYNPGELYDCIDWLRRARSDVLDNVEVITAGFPPGEAARRGLSAYITERGVVPHTEAVSLMRSANLLFLSHVDAARQSSVPGKLYEYLASGAPVLALTDPEQETAQVLRTVGGGVAISPDHPGRLYDALGEICRLKRFDVPALKPDALAAFERRQLTGRLAHILDGACYMTRSTQAGSSADSPTRSSYAGSTSAQPATRVVS